MVYLIDTVFLTAVENPIFQQFHNDYRPKKFPVELFLDALCFIFTFS